MAKIFNFKVKPEDDPTNFRAVITRIKTLWANGTVVFTNHASERMVERGIDSTDINNIINTGRIIEHSLDNLRKDVWCYKIEGKLVDGGNASCVVKIDGSLIIITVII